MPTCRPAVLAVSLVLAAPTVQAADASRSVHENAAALCQGALPAFAGTLRARPLGIGNEGGAPAFVTCSSRGGQPGSMRTSGISAQLSNFSAATLTISCTLVNGYQGWTGTSYTVKTLTLPAGSRGMLSWANGDLPGEVTLIANPNLSCALAPGVSLDFIGQFYLESVGA